MKVQEVIYSDFSLLVDGYVKAKMENCGAGTYGVKADSYFQNMVISFYLSDISFVELLGIRKICSSLIPVQVSVNEMNFDISSSNDNEKSKDCNDKFHQLSRGLVSLRNTINDAEVRYPFEKDSILLTGNYSFDLIARFEGSNIMSIIGVFPESKFYNHDLGNFEVPDKESLDNLLITDFIKSLYNTINSQLSSVDILTDIMIKDKFFSYLDPASSVKLSHITSSFGELRVLNSTQQGIVSEIRSIKQLRDSLPVYDSTKFFNDDVVYHVTVMTPIQTYMLFQLYSNFVYSEEDLKVIFASDEVEYFIPDELTDFSSRIESFIGSMSDLRHEIIKISKDESDKMSVNRVDILTDSNKYGSKGTQTVKNQSSSFDRIGIYRLIPSSAYIHYTLKFTKSDFDKLKLDIPDYLKTSDLEKVFMNIHKFIKTIEKSL